MTDERVEIERSVDVAPLTWPVGDFRDEGLGGNRAYSDFRGFSWKEAVEALQFEDDALNRRATKPDVKNLDDLLEDDEYAEDLDGLDLGVASTVLALSAARCVPVTSCNGSAGHHERYPLVVFYAKAAWIPLLDEAAEEAGCGLDNADEGMLMVYANEIDAMLAFARAMIARRSALNKLHLRDTPKQSPRVVSRRHGNPEHQLKLQLPD